MKQERIIKIRLADAAAFRKWQRLKAALKAGELRLEELHKQAGLPVSKKFRRNCRRYLTDGNGTPVAKFSVFDMPPREIKACKVCRIT